MKKLLIAIVIALIAGMGYFSYEKWGKHSNLTSWSFIPGDAAMVLELELLDDLEGLEGHKLWKSLSDIEGFTNINNGINFLDSLNGSGGFRAIFKETPALISMHKVSKDRFDFLFVVDIQNISQNTFIGASIGRLQQHGYRFKTRNYNGFKISEISKNGHSFACIFYKNFLLASFTPYLVEDAIRTIEGSQIGYLANKKNLQSNDELFGIYANYQQISNLFSGISKEELDIPLNTGGYSFSLDSNFVNISGITDAEQTGWVSTFKGDPSTFDIAEVIPENTAFVYHISTTDFTRWKQNQMNHLRDYEPDIVFLQDSLKAALDFDAGQVIDLIDEEIGIVEIESTGTDAGRLCILELKEAQKSMKFFEGLTERIANSRGDSIYMESYSQNEIRYLPLSNFPQIFLGKIAGEFDQCFYINHRNYLIISNDLDELKSVISAISEENTWGKSLHVNEFLESTNNTANISLFVNIPRSLNIIDNKLNYTWRDHFRDNNFVYKNFDFAAFQLSYLDDEYFTNIIFSQPALKRSTVPPTNSFAGLRFAHKIISKPYLLKTHAHKNHDILVQDSTNTVYYMDPNQNTLWTTTLEDSIISNIFPIDYYNNGKIQYVFATEENIHIWDRKGMAIPGFPKALSSVGVDHFNVIDYDLSKNYRFAISDETGSTFLTDKDLNMLEGWKPRKFNRKSIKPLIHKRIGRRDVMISVQQNGIINLTNRRGENLSGFPFDTDERLDNNLFIRTSNTLANSAITLISISGELIEVNMEGDLIQRNQLIKTSPEVSFEIIPDLKGKSYLIARKEGNRRDILDETGNLLFSKDYFSEGEVLLQYYEFGAGRDLIVFVDTASTSIYIYDRSGNLLTGNPLKGNHEISILYSAKEREFQVYTTWGSSLELFKFKI